MTRPARREVDSGLLQNLLCCRRCYLHSQAGQLAVDPAVAPFGVVAGQPEDEGLDVRAGGRAAGLGAHGPRRPAVPDDVAVPAHDGVRGDRKPQPVAAGFGYHAEQGREQGPVCEIALTFAGSRCLRNTAWGYATVSPTWATGQQSTEPGELTNDPAPVPPARLAARQSSGGTSR